MSRHAPPYVRAARVAARFALAAVLSASLLITAPSSFVEPAAASAYTVNTASRSEAEIAATWERLKPVHTGGAYSVPPSTKSPYATGTVAPGLLKDGLNAVNFVRYLAGLPSDVVLDSTMNSNAQHGAVLLAASNFSHTPRKPADMSQTFYDKALESTKKSNIGTGYKALSVFQQSCVADSTTASNLLAVGHRRWLLNPPLKKTGMGYAEGKTTTYVLDKSRTETIDYSAITWPAAGAFPVEFFTPQTPWSITLNPAKYDWNATGHKVTLRRLSDGKTWSFDASQTDTARQYFNADFSSAGVNNVFVFRPNPTQISYSPGDEFEVVLSGGIRHKGTSTSATIKYRTRFFSIGSPAPAVQTGSTATPSSAVTKPSVTFSTGSGGVHGTAPRMSTYTHTPGQAYSAYGYFKPRRAMNTNATVRVLAYRYERKSNGQMGYVYKRSYLARVTNPSGSAWSKYSASVVLPSPGKWRLRTRYYEDSQTKLTNSAYRYVTVKPKATVAFSTGGTGSAANAVRMSTYTHTLGRTYTTYGYFKPRRTVNTQATVRVLAYRYERKSNGQMGYVYKRSYLARVTNPSGSAWSKYTASVKLPSKGKWRLRVRYYGDAWTNRTTSGYRYVTVR